MKLKIGKIYRYSNQNKSEDSEIRKSEAVPIVFCERMNYDKRTKWNLKFQGFGVFDSAKLIIPLNKNEKAVQIVIRQAELKCKEMVG